MADDLRVYWRNHYVGKLRDPIPDMWYLEGIWAPGSDTPSRQFEALAKSFELKAVFKDLTKGTRVLLKEGPDGEGIHAAVISLSDNKLFVRRVVDPEAVKWLMANVR